MDIDHESMKPNKSGYIPVQTTEPTEPETVSISVDAARLQLSRPEPCEEEIEENEFSTCCVIGYIIQSMFIVYIVCAKVFLYLDSHDPEFRVNSVTLTPFNLSTPDRAAAANWNVVFNVTNNNNVTTFWYENGEVLLSYKNELVAATIMKHFSQKPGDQTTVQVTFGSSSITVDKWVSSAIAREQMLGQAVYFDVTVEGWMWRNPRPRGGMEKKQWMTVRCWNVKVEFASSRARNGTSIDGGSQKCYVETIDG